MDVPRSATSSTQVTVDGKTVAVDKPFWYAGFKVTVKDASLRNGRPELGGPPGPVVAIAATFENVGVQRAAFNGTTVLQSSGRNHFKRGEGEDIPEIPGGASQDGVIVIVVDPTFRLDDATLVVGRVDANQARVPLGNRGDLVSLEPRSIPITARLATESLTIDIRGAELRADRPRRHQQVEAGKRELKLSYTGVLSNCQFASYSLRLVLPDGSIVEASDRGESLTLDSFSVFPVSDRPAGAYTVKLGGGFLNSTSPKCPKTFSADAPFTIT